VVRALEAARLLDRAHVLGLLHDADHAVIAIRALAIFARIALGDVVADRAVRDALLRLAYRLQQQVRLLAGRPEDVKRETLRALRADAGQSLQPFDQADERLGQRHHTVHMLTPDVQLKA
jgi:hypothetical protein